MIVSCMKWKWIYFFGSKVEYTRFLSNWPKRLGLFTGPMVMTDWNVTSLQSAHKQIFVRWNLACWSSNNKKLTCNFWIWCRRACRPCCKRTRVRCTCSGHRPPRLRWRTNTTAALVRLRKSRLRTCLNGRAKYAGPLLSPIPVSKTNVSQYRKDPNLSMKLWSSQVNMFT